MTDTTLLPCPDCKATHSRKYTCEEAAAYRQEVEDEIAIYSGFYLGITPPAPVSGGK